MFYHIILRQKGVYPEQIKLDLTEHDLDEKILTPYYNGVDLKILGKTIPLGEISRITITRTDEDSKELIKKPNFAAKNWLNPNVRLNQSDRSRIALSGEDVTREFITGPPGSNKLIRKAVQNDKVVDKRKVFVVHGRNVKLSVSMFSFLEAIGLEPIDWSEAIKGTGNATPYIGEVLEYVFSAAQAIVVLMTPDDLAYLKPELRKKDDDSYERELTPQARQNVLFEAGMSMGKNPARTIIIEIGKLRPFSDLGGRHVIRMSGSESERKEIAYRLKNAGCTVDTSGDDWKTIGDFELPEFSKHTKIATKNGEYIPNELDVKIMIVIGHHYDGGRTIEELAENFKSGLQRLRLILDNLVEYEFIRWDTGSFERWGAYHLEPKGREFLNSKNLL